jgi:hypothetical protein
MIAIDDIEFKPIEMRSVDLEFLAFREFTIEEIRIAFSGEARSTAPTSDEAAVPKSEKIGA